MSNHNTRSSSGARKNTPGGKKDPKDGASKKGKRAAGNDVKGDDLKKKSRGKVKCEEGLRLFPDFSPLFSFPFAVPLGARGVWGETGAVKLRILRFRPS